MEAYVPSGWRCGCGKIQWLHRKDAKETLKRMIRNGAWRDPDRPLRVFESCDGTGYHIGHGARRGRNLNDPNVRVLPEDR